MAKFGQAKCTTMAGLVSAMILAAIPLSGFADPQTVSSPTPVTADTTDALPGKIKVASISDPPVVLIPETAPIPAVVKEATVLLPDPVENKPPDTGTSTTLLVAGSLTAVALAPISAPASILFGITVGVITPTSAQFGLFSTEPSKKNR